MLTQFLDEAQFRPATSVTKDVFELRREPPRSVRNEYLALSGVV